MHWKYYLCLYPAQHNFDFAFIYTANGIDYTLDTSVVEIKVLHYVQTWIDASKTNRISTELEFEKWNDAFDKVNKADSRRIGINNYYCTKKKDYSISGTFYSPTFKYINLQMIRWRNSTKWKTDAEIDSIIKSGRFSVSKVNSYINMNEYTSPIHYFIDDGLYWDMLPGIRKWTNVYIRENTANFQDNYIQIGDPKQVTNQYRG